MVTRRKRRISWMCNLSSSFENREVPVKRSLPKTRAYHNLSKLFDKVKALYFSKSEAKRPISMFRLGYHSPQKKLIKINRILNYPHTPKYFVSSITFHEELHCLFPYIVSSSERKINYTKFKKALLRNSS